MMFFFYYCELMMSVACGVQFCIAKKSYIFSFSLPDHYLSLTFVLVAGRGLSWTVVHLRFVHLSYPSLSFVVICFVRFFLILYKMSSFTISTHLFMHCKYISSQQGYVL